MLKTEKTDFQRKFTDIRIALADENKLQVVKALLPCSCQVSTKGRWNATSQASINSVSFHVILLFYWVKGIRKSVFLFFPEFSFFVFVSWRFYFQPWMQSPDKEFLSLYSCNCFNLTEYWFQYMISLARDCATFFPFQHSTFSIDTLYPGSQKRGYDLNIISCFWSGQQQKMPNFDKHIFGKHNYAMNSCFTSNTLPNRRRKYIYF